MNHQNNKTNIFSLYKYRLMSIFIPASMLTIISLLITLCIYIKFDTYMGVSLCSRNISAVYIFTLMIPILTGYAFSYMFKTSENDFINSVPFTKTQIFIANICAVLTYTLIPLISILSLNIKSSNSEIYHALKAEFSPTAVSSYFICSILAMSCIIIGISISKSLFSGILIGYLIMFLPRIFINSLKEIIFTKCPFIPNSELFFIFNSKLNLITTRLINENQNIFNCNVYTKLSSILYTFVLAVIYLFIGFIVYKRRKNSLRSGFISYFRNKSKASKQKYIIKFLSVIIILALLSAGMVLGTYYYCHKEKKNIPNQKDVNYVKLTFLENSNTFYDLKNENYSYDSMSYANYYAHNLKLDDRSTISLICRYFNNTVNARDYFNTNATAYTYCKVEFHTKDDCFSRYAAIPTKGAYSDILNSIYTSERIKSLITNMPSASKIYDVMFSGADCKLPDKAIDEIYETYKQELSENFYINSLNSVQSDPTLLYVSSEFPDINLTYTFKENNMYYQLVIPITDYFPKTQKIVYKEYLLSSKNEIVSVLNSIKYNPTQIFNFFTYDSEIMYIVHYLTDIPDNMDVSKYNNLDLLIDIISSNLNNPDKDYTYFTMQTELGQYLVPLDLNDAHTEELVDSLSN